VDGDKACLADDLHREGGRRGRTGRTEGKTITQPVSRGKRGRERAKTTKRARKRLEKKTVQGGQYRRWRRENNHDSAQKREPKIPMEGKARDSREAYHTKKRQSVAPYSLRASRT